MTAPERTASDSPALARARTGALRAALGGLRRRRHARLGPAGSGKTVLLRSWIEAAGLGERTAWVSVERDERDEQRFWLAVVEALRTAAGMEGPIDDLGPAPGFDGDAVVERIIDGARVARRTPPARHRRSASPARAKGDGTAGAVADAPAAAAADRSCRLATIRRSGSIDSVSPASSPSCAQPTFGSCSMRQTSCSPPPGSRSPPPPSARFRHARRAGSRAFGSRRCRWQVGQIRSVSLPSSPAASERLPTTCSPRCLQREPEPVRQLLLRTSILERVNGEIADRLLGTEGSERYPARARRRRRLRILHRPGTVLVPLPQPPRRSPASRAAAHRARRRSRSAPRSLPSGMRSTGSPSMPSGTPRPPGIGAMPATSSGSSGSASRSTAASRRCARCSRPFPKEAFANPELAAFLAYGEVIRPSLDTAASYIALAERHASEVPEERVPLFEAMLTTATRLTLARWRGDYTRGRARVDATVA